MERFILKDIQNIIEASVQKLIKSDSYLLRIKLKEEYINHKLAIHLENVWRGKF